MSWLRLKPFIKNTFNDELQLRGLLEDGVLPAMKLSDESLAKVEDPIVKKVIQIMGASGGAFSHFDSTVQSEVYKEFEAQIQKLPVNPLRNKWQMRCKRHSNPLTLNNKGCKGFSFI